ncbi:UDP-2,3-diacylglucosamine diphosphatase [Chitinispirillum alkaliphilum]|nr:UDP-2,3-diacylglucosamine diphosphatase [Chitinispirillum alkaliphilum]
MSDSRNTAYFISDAHFGISLPGFENRDKRFCEFVDSIKENASHLFILGDLFDFWIEYKHAIRPDYFLILYQLRKLVESGVKVHYLAGNHDFALGSFLNNTVEISICSSTLDLTIQGKRIFLFHGDGILKRDVGYRILKKMLRNRINQKLYKMLHPGLGIPFGIFCSGSSRKHSSRLLTPELVKEYRQAAVKKFGSGYDVVMFGHTHHGEVVRFGDKIYCNTGAWLKHYNYVSMKDGELTLWEFSQDKSSKAVDPIDIKQG